MDDKAMTIIERAKSSGALVFVNQENFQSGIELYKTEATVIKAKPEEFHKLNGKYMPNKAVTDRIGEATGIQFIASEVRTETRDDAIAGKRTVFVGTAQGKVRMPDGSWRTSTSEEYEFDPVLRALLDKNVEYITDTNKGLYAKAALEYTKVGRQRAATGARLRVIRQLTGMPHSFELADISKPMVFTRIVQNTAHILDTKEGRLMATAQALGADVSSLLFGKNAQIQQMPVESEQNINTDVNEDDLKPADVYTEDITPSDMEALAAQADPAPSAEESDQKKEFEELTIKLEELLAAHTEKLNVNLPSGMNPYALAKSELDDFSATVQSRKDMIERTKKFLIACKVAV